MAKNNEENMYKQKVSNWEHSSRTRYWQSMFHHLDTSPEPNHSMLDVTKSLCMLSIHEFLNDSAQQYRFDQLKEITSYHKHDAQGGILIRFTIKGNEKNEKELELFVQSKANITRKDIKFRQGKFQLGENFDLKERVFKNLLNSVGSHSKPGLMYSVADSYETNEQNFTMKVAWIDPYGIVRNITYISISDISVNKEIIQPGFMTPMIPGIWTVLVINQRSNQFLCRIPFLVFSSKVMEQNDMIYELNEELSQELVKIFQETQSKHDMKLLKLSDKYLYSQQFQQDTNNNIIWSKLLLVKEFYSLVSICIVVNDETYNDSDIDVPDLDIPVCKDTLWSSFSPDPKSSTSTFDEQLGRLV
jgi:hypothetical protein